MMAEPAPDLRDCVAALLLVVCDSPLVLAPGAQPCERVKLILLRASSRSAAHCAQHLAQQPEAGHLPWAAASLSSLQPPYVAVRYCPSARGLAAELGWGGPGCGGLFVLDSETTGLCGECFQHMGTSGEAQMHTLWRLRAPPAAPQVGTASTNWRC